MYQKAGTTPIRTGKCLAIKGFELSWLISVLSIFKGLFVLEIFSEQPLNVAISMALGVVSRALFFHVKYPVLKCKIYSVVEVISYHTADMAPNILMY